MLNQTTILQHLAIAFYFPGLIYSMEVENTEFNQPASKLYQLLEWTSPTLTDFVYNAYDHYFVKPECDLRLKIIKRKREENTVASNNIYNQNVPYLIPEIIDHILTYLSESPWSIRNLYLTSKVFHTPIISMIETVKIERFQFKTRWVNYDHHKDRTGRIYKFRTRLEEYWESDVIKIGDISKGVSGLRWLEYNGEYCVNNNGESHNRQYWTIEGFEGIASYIITREFAESSRPKEYLTEVLVNTKYGERVLKMKKDLGC